MASLPNSFHCEYPECDKNYNSYNNLLRHYRANKQHKPDNLENKKKPNAVDVINEVFQSNISEGTRSARIKEFVNRLTEEEINANQTGLAVEKISLYDVLLTKATVNGFVNTAILLREFTSLRDKLYETYPEVKAVAETTGRNNKSEVNNLSSMVVFLLANKHLLSKAFLEAESGKIFREELMPLVFEKYQDNFVEFACGIVGSFCLGQKQLQDVLRNTWGKYIASVLGVNIIPPKAVIVNKLKQKKQELTELIGLHFEVHEDLVVAKINVSKYLEYLMSRPSVQISEIAPKNKMLVYQFTDLAPWLKWSRYFTAITTSRLKVVECHNLHRLVITAGVYLGPDDYDTIRQCFGSLYQEYANAREIVLPHCESPVQVLPRSCADGKQRRVDTGSSSSRSTYPIPDAPEHISLLGNMSVICTEPVWTFKDTQDLEEKWLQEQSTDTGKQTRSEFAKNNLGNQGRLNTTTFDLKNYFPGSMHLAIRSAETLSIQIGMCAVGKLINIRYV